MKCTVSLHSPLRLTIASFVAVVLALLLSPLLSPTHAATIAAGTNHTCAVEPAGSVQCWGAHPDLGPNGTANAPAPVPGLTGAIGVAAGAFHTCVLRAAGTVACWGAGSNGELGRGNREASSTPIDVPGITDAVAVAAAGYDSCALRATGQILCWGWSHGTVNGGMPSGQVSPTPFASTGAARGVIVSGYITCAVETAKTACRTRLQANADNSSTYLPTAVEVPTTGDVTAVTSSPWGHECLLRGDGRAQCRGFNSAGQLGNGQVSGDRAGSFADVTQASDYVALGAAAQSTCGLTTGGAVECWGANSYGELGDGTVTGRSTPAPINTLSNIKQIATGQWHVCAADQSGGVWCWGSNRVGQVGDGEAANVLTPRRVSNVTAATQLVNNYPANALPGGESASQVPTAEGFAVRSLVRRAATGSATRYSGKIVGMSGKPLRVRSGKRCPKRVTAKITAPGRSAAVKRLTVSRDGREICKLDAAVKLQGKLGTARRVGVSLSGPGVVSERLTISRR